MSETATCGSDPSECLESCATDSSAIDARVGALEREFEEARRRSRWYVLAPSILIPFAVMLFQHCVLYLPSQVASLQFEIEQYNTVIDKNDLGVDTQRPQRHYHFVFKVTNVGYKALDAGKAHLFVRFSAPIVNAPNPAQLPPGTLFKSDADVDVTNCAGLAACKVILGSMAGQGLSTLVLPFSSSGDVDTAPVLNHEGREIKPHSCGGVLQQICPHLHKS